MTREEISAAIGGIDDRYIEEAAEGCRKNKAKPLFLRFLPAAACLVLILVSASFLIPWQQSDSFQNSSNETAAPADGAMPEDGLSAECREPQDGQAEKDAVTNDSLGASAPAPLYSEEAKDTEATLSELSGRVTAVSSGTPKENRQDHLTVLRVEMKDGTVVSVEVPEGCDIAAGVGSEIFLSYHADSKNETYIKKEQVAELTLLKGE